MLKKPQWVIFDVGGVLFDYQSAARDIAHHLNISEEKLIEEATQYDNEGELGKITFDDAWVKILQAFNKEEHFDEIIPLWWDKKRWLLDTQRLIRELHQSGYNLALFTNNWTGVRERWLLRKELPVIQYRFESVIEKVCKPDPHFYQIVEKQIKSSGDNIYFIDNSLPNIETAQKRKWQTFLYSIGEDKGKSANDAIRKDLLHLAKKE